MKKYLKITGYILGALLIITILAIASRSIFKSYADTTIKTSTASNIIYEFDAEDENATTGIAHNVRIIGTDEKFKDSTTTVSIPNTFKVDSITYKVESIGNGTDSALINTVAWTKVTIPTNVKSINANAFKNCTTLTDVIFTSKSNCGKIGESAFYGCTALSNVQGDGTKNRMPANTITIEDYAFYDCTSLEKLDLYTGVTTLGRNTFRGTTEETTPPLTELTIRSNIKEHNGAFAGHTGITTLKFVGSGCTTIYDSMFEGCTGITSVNQRTTVTNSDGSTSSKYYIVSIGERAFFGCTGLNAKKSITYSLNKELQVGKDAYRFGRYAEDVTEKPTINIEQSVDKADTEYYTNGIGKVTMNISSTDVEKTNPKDYIVCIDTTGSMDTKTKVEVPKTDSNGNVVTDKNGNVTMVKRSKMEIAVEALQLLANKIYEENPKNRLAIVTQKGSSYLFMNFLDGSNVDKVNELIGGMSTSSKGNKEYGSSSAYYTSSGGTDYVTGLRTMADVIMERQTERERNVYGIFISDGYPNCNNSYIQGAAAQLKGFCDAVWSVSIALVKDDVSAGDETEEIDPDDLEDVDDEEFEEEEIDAKDLTRFLKYIRTYWGHNPLFYDFPDTGELSKDFQAFMQSIVDVSTSSLQDIIFRSKLNTDIWEFYTGTEYTNSEGCNITDSQNATFKFDRVGKDKKEEYYYIRLKDDKRNKADPQLLVSNNLTAEYTIAGGNYNGWRFDQEQGWVFDSENTDEEYIKKYQNHGVKALNDTPLYLDWIKKDINTRPGKLEITKTGEALVRTEESSDGKITPVYEEVKIQGAEFEVYAKEDIFELENKLCEKDALVKRIVTDENGKAELENLPIGKYYIKEVKAGDGFTLNEERKEFEVVDQGEDKTIQKVEIAYKNERQKVNINGKEGLIVEKIADKKLYKPGEEIIYTIRITNTTQEIIKKILVKETMIQGKFEDISTDNVVKGDDTTVGIRELKPGESVELKFIANITSPAEKEKIENHVIATGKIEVPDPIPGNPPIEEDITGEDDEEVYIATKDLVIIKEALKDEYEVGETVQYVIKVINNGLTDITDVVVEEKMLNGQFVNIEEANQGGAEVKKVDNQKVTISKIEPGQMITLMYEYEITKDTKVTVDDEQRIILENNVKVKGKIIPPGPTPNPPPTEIEDEDGEKIEINKDSEGNGLGIIKTDIETGKTIQGAVIGLYAAENITGDNGEIIIARDTLIEKVTTDENGKAKYTVDLPLGKYYIKEIEAPVGYMLSEEKMEIDATYRGQEIEAINIGKVLTNRKTTLDFAIDKTLSSISIDGENIPIKNDKLSKLEIKSGNIDKANVIVTYKIKVKNKVNIEGTTKVLEIVPKGYEMISSSENWTTRPDGTLETEVSLGANESKELEITLKWMNGESNLGERVNVAKLEIDGDTDPDDDTSQATVIISVKTGEIVSAIIIIMIVASLGIAGYMTTQVVSKMGKGPDIQGINFLKNKNK